MKQIYYYDKRRSRSTLVGGLILGVFLTGYGIRGMIFNYGTPHIAVGMAISFVPLGIGFPILVWAIRQYMRAPIEVFLLENKAILIQTRHSKETFSSNQIKDIRFRSFDRSDGFLRIRTKLKTWHLPVTVAEAEGLTQAMTSLNPSIVVTRLEDSSV